MKFVFLVPISAQSGVFARVDVKDYSRILRYRWFLVKGYAVCHPKKGETVSMHRMILGLPKRYPHVDHRNTNKLDNTRRNLRVSTPLQNSRNKRKWFLHRRLSQYKGVAPSISRTNPWQAAITVNDRNIYLGSFADEISAARAYNEAAIKFFGDFCSLNDVVRGEKRIAVRKKSSRFPGVVWHKAMKKWQVRIVSKGKVIVNEFFRKEKKAYSFWKQAKGKEPLHKLKAGFSKS